MKTVVGDGDGRWQAVLMSVFSSYLDQAFVGFRPTVTKESLLKTHRLATVFHQQFCGFLLLGNLVKITHMEKLGHLLLEGRHQFRMGVTQVRHGDTT